VSIPNSEVTACPGLVTGKYDFNVGPHCKVKSQWHPDLCRQNLAPRRTEFILVPNKRQMVLTNLEAPTLSGNSTISAGATLTDPRDAAGSYARSWAHAPFIPFKRVCEGALQRCRIVCPARYWNCLQYRCMFVQGPNCCSSIHEVEMNTPKTLPIAITRAT
jgi:hypothetical protein